MKYLYLLIAASFFFGAASAQSKCTVLKAKAYFSIHQPGNIQVDESGNQKAATPSKERFIYISTSCNVKPVISVLRYGQAQEKAAVERIATGGDIYFKAPKGAYIWKINVEENDKQAAEDSKPNIYLKLLINKKTQVIRLYAETLLPSPDRP